MLHTITNMFETPHKNIPVKSIVIKKNNASTPIHPQYVKSESSSVIVITPQKINEAKVLAANSKAATIAINQPLPKETILTSNNINESIVTQEPDDLLEYDTYAKNISTIKHQIELNKLKTELYKSQTSYEDLDGYDGAKLIGVIIDSNGYKSAKLKLPDNSVTDVVIGSRFGKYFVSSISINEVDLRDPRCTNNSKRHKKNPSNSNQIINNNSNIHVDYKANDFNKDSLLDTTICHTAKIYPLYRDTNNKFPATSTNPNSSPNPSTNSGFNTTNSGSNGLTLTIPPIETNPRGN